MNNRPSFLKDVTIFSKYMNIKASHMEKHRTKWCKYKKAFCFPDVVPECSALAVWHHKTV